MACMEQNYPGWGEKPPEKVREKSTGVHSRSEIVPDSPRPQPGWETSKFVVTGRVTGRVLAEEREITSPRLNAAPVLTNLERSERTKLFLSNLTAFQSKAQAIPYRRRTLSSTQKS